MKTARSLLEERTSAWMDASSCNALVLWIRRVVKNQDCQLDTLIIPTTMTRRTSGTSINLHWSPNTTDIILIPTCGCPVTPSKSEEAISYPGWMKCSVLFDGKNFPSLVTLIPCVASIQRQRGPTAEPSVMAESAVKFIWYQHERGWPPKLKKVVLVSLFISSIVSCQTSSVDGRIA